MVVQRLTALGATAPTVGLDVVASRALLSDLGFPVMAGDAVTSVREAEEVAAAIGYPVVLKVVSPDLAHKTEAGAVRLAIRDTAELRVSWQEMMSGIEALDTAVQVTAMLVERYAPGLEVVLGTVRDEQLGPMVMVGAGGVHAEIQSDVAMRLAPVSVMEAARMIDELRTIPVLRGFRGAPVADETALAQLVARLSHFAAAYRDRVVEVEMNPVIFSEGEWRAADALVILGEEGPTASE